MGIWGRPAFGGLRTWLADRSGRVVLILGLYVLAFVAWVAWGADRLPYREAIGDLAFPPMGLAAWALAWQAGQNRALPGRARAAWRVIALALLSWTAGDVAWAYLEVVRGVSPFPSVADIGYLLFYPLMMAGLLLFPHAPATAAERATFWLDAATVLLGGWMVIWYFVLGPIALSAQASTVETVLSTAYPIGDLVMIFGVAALLLRQPQAGDRTALGLLGAAVGAFLAADIGFGYLTLQDRYRPGDWPDALWMLAWWLAAAAAGHQAWTARVRPPVERTGIAQAVGISPLPYLAAVLGYILLFVAGRYATPYPLGGLLYAAIALTGVVLIRQLTVMGENLRLLGSLRELATTDSLTGLLNRRAFFDLAEREFARYQRYRHPLCAVMVDVDNFKDLNDRYGHLAGDEILQHVARQIRQELRRVDVAARFGGDELVLLLPETGIDDALRVVSRLRHAVAEMRLSFGEHLLRTSISAGVASADGCPSLEALLQRADLALYQAKQAGRDQVRVFEGTSGRAP
ncbi:MAG: GGDEF domain-containing protein [Armatimonadota bacterium]|nr:GGDEF domain-containing protein [Armatimonadota bacterium]MDR7404683.1 GGDEF domain-containing protein [Armatimonadota bacterium]